MSGINKRYDSYHEFEMHMITVILCTYECHVNCYTEGLSCIKIL